MSRLNSTISRKFSRKHAMRICGYNYLIYITNILCDGLSKNRGADLATMLLPDQQENG
jgi:hypothetical protein